MYKVRCRNTRNQICPRIIQKYFYRSIGSSCSQESVEGMLLRKLIVIWVCRQRVKYTYTVFTYKSSQENRKIKTLHHLRLRGTQLKLHLFSLRWLPIPTVLRTYTCNIPVNCTGILVYYTYVCPTLSYSRQCRTVECRYRQCR